LLDPLGNGFAAAEEKHAKQEIAREQKASDESHFLQVHIFYRSFALGAN